MSATASEAPVHWTSWERGLHRVLLSRGAVAIPLLTYGVFAYFNWNAWHCADDPLTVWASLWAESCSDVYTRSQWLPQLPTYFWVARATGILFGGLEGIRLGSQAAGLAAVLVSFYVTRWLAPRSYLPVALGVMMGILTSFAYFYSCARPYGWLPLFFLLQLTGLACALRERPSLGIALAGVGGGLAGQFSAVTLPTASCIFGLTILIAWWRGAGLRNWLLPALATVPLLAIAAAKAISLAVFFAPSDGAQLFWLSDAPAWFPLSYATVIAITTVAILALRRAGYHDAPSDVFSNRDVVAIALLGLVFPAVVLALHLASNLNLYAPWYFTFENLAALILICILVLCFSHPRVRLHALVGGLAFGISVCGFLDYWITREVSDFRWDANFDVYEHVLEHARDDDVVIVVSLWPNAHFEAFYENESGLSLVLSEALLHPDMNELQLYPAPPGPFSTHPTWTSEVAKMLAQSPRVWLIPKAWFKRFWRDDPPIWALEQLRELGYEPVGGAHREAFASRLFLLERPSHVPGSRPAASAPAVDRTHAHRTVKAMP